MNNYVKLIFLLPAFLLIHVQSKAQLITNITSFLGVKHLGTSLNPNFNADVPSMASALDAYEADCFLVTFELDPISSPVTDMDILTFNVISDSPGHDFLSVGISANKKGWYVNRRYVNGSVINNWVRYRSYDDIGYDGKFTLILSRNFIGIGRDEAGTAKWYFTPMFFGLDSNLGYAGSNTQAGEYLGTSSNSTPARIFRSGELSIQNKSISVFSYCKGGGSCTSFKLNDLIKALDSDAANGNTVNQRMAFNAPADSTATDIQPLVDASPSDVKKEEKPYVFPNPTFGEFTVGFTLPRASAVELLVTDILGRPVYTQSHNLEEGAHQLKTSIPATEAKGVFTVTVKSATFWAVQKIVVE